MNICHVDQIRRVVFTHREFVLHSHILSSDILRQRLTKLLYVIDAAVHASPLQNDP